jgi:hypothetical protein
MYYRTEQFLLLYTIHVSCKYNIKLNTCNAIQHQIKYMQCHAREKQTCFQYYTENEQILLMEKSVLRIRTF